MSGNHTDLESLVNQRLERIGQTKIVEDCIAVGRAVEKSVPNKLKLPAQEFCFFDALFPRTCLARHDHSRRRFRYNGSRLVFIAMKSVTLWT